MIQKKSEDAVSPVIGVMLLLVVTIVLATIVAAFAGGFGTEAEPMPATAVDVVGLSGGYYEMQEIVTITGNIAQRNVRVEDGIRYAYYYAIVDGEQIEYARKNYATQKNEKVGDRTDLHEKYLNIETTSVLVEDIGVTLSCLHGDSLDLSKVSIQIYRGGNLVSETPKNTYSGTLSPGDRETLRTGANLDTGFVYDVIVYYGSHKIADVEKLKVTGVA